jgi:hypothetical protein
MTRPPTPDPLAGRSLRAPVLWGVVSGVIQAASPLGFWWLDPATVYALSLALIAAVYIGFAVADARPRVIAVEAGVAAAFYVANTRWWPPFCPVIDWVAAAILVVLITVGVDFHH